MNPCEPLIPVLMYPAAKGNIAGVILVTMVFAIVTIGIMLGMVYLLMSGIIVIRFGKMEKYMHVFAGLVVLLSGVGIKFFWL